MSDESKMTIDNTSWSIDKLLNNIYIIIKPKFQRDKKWTILPMKPKIPSYKGYIEFLIKRENSVFPISLGSEIKDNKETYIVIDGNNRINAIITFLQKPYELFNEYYVNIFSIIDNADIEYKDKLKSWIKNIDYKNISSFRRINDLPEYPEVAEANFQNILESELVEIQTKFLTKDRRSYDKIINLNMPIFKGGTYEEYCETFVDINTFANTLSENELLSGMLFNTEVILDEDNLNFELKKTIKDYYDNRGSDEVLATYSIQIEDKMNVFDFMVGFQNYCNKLYYIIPNFESEGLSLFFRIFKLIYYNIDKDSFTKENINIFIKKILNACDILSKAFNKIFPENINHNLFNKSSIRSNKLIKKNAMILLLISNIINTENLPHEKLINKNRICIIYHLLSNKKYLTKFNEEDIMIIKGHDKLELQAGGSYIENLCNNIISGNNVIFKIKREKIEDLLKMCIKSSITEKSVVKRTLKRRKLTMLDQILFSNFWYCNMPNKYIKQKYSTEHITPYSSSWNELLDIDRLGNMFPTLDELNNQRGNKDFTSYKKKNPEFYNNIKCFEPNNYKEVNEYKDRKTKIISNEKYNEYCSKNEDLCINTLIKELYD